MISLIKFLHPIPGVGSLTMFAAAFALVLVAALLANMQSYSGSSVAEIIAVNAFFIFLYYIAGLFFRFVALHQPQAKTEG